MDDQTTNGAKSAHPPTRDETRAAKTKLLELLGGVRGVGAFGIGQTEDGSSMAVTVAASSRSALARIPKDVDGVPVRAYLSGPGQAF